jgi:hypothetical protein
VSVWKSRDVAIAQVDLWPVATPGAVEKRGVAHRLTETVKSVVDGAAVLVEECVIRKPRGGVLLRRTRAVPFVVDVDGERLIVTGTVRITSPFESQKLDSVAAALGVPASLPIRGVLEHARVRDGDRVRLVGLTSTEIVRELAYPSRMLAGETTAMRGVANAVVAIEGSA